MKKHLKLKAYRIMAGLTQADMATVIGKSTDMYRKKENGQIDFCVKELLLIRNKLNMGLQDLFC